MKATVLAITAAAMLVAAGAVAQAQQSGAPGQSVQGRGLNAPRSSGATPGHRREGTTGAADRDDWIGSDRDDRMLNQGTTGAGDRDDRPRSDGDDVLRRDDER